MDQIDMLMRQALALLTATPEQLAEAARIAAAKAKQRQAKQNAKFAAALDSMSDAQAVIVGQRELEGFKTVRVLSRNNYRTVAVMLQKSEWDSRKSRVGVRLMMVYPDATSASTFERSISVRPSF